MKIEYKIKNQPIELEIDEDKLLVQFQDTSSKSEREELINKLQELGAFSNRFEVPGEPYTILDVAQSSDSKMNRFNEAFTALNAQNYINKVSYVFKAGAKKLIVTDRLITKFEDSETKQQEFFAKENLEVLKQVGSNYILKSNSDEDIFNVINRLNDLPNIDYAEPDFITIGAHTSVIKPLLKRKAMEDPFAKKQYALEITKAIEAVKLQRGRPEIKIAILDEGVFTDHPDLKDAIVDAYDATEGDTYQEPNAWDAHGTACAGLAAAVPNNNLGIRGIAGGCSLMAIRIAFSPEPDKDWIIANSWIVAAIDWAWKNGADVLSNSWGGGITSFSVRQAFLDARKEGRDGKGCVVIAAAGNESSGVSQPAALDGILAVSASNEFDEAKTKYSRDMELWWGTNFGPEVDVAAPGVHNLTTDIPGLKGYNDGTFIDGDYTDFNGTSSATPIVAGVAALVLSANPDMEEEQVREIIRSTADKVGRIPYPNGRNDYMGYGRVNALEAVKKALSLNEIS